MSGATGANVDALPPSDDEEQIEEEEEPEVPASVPPKKPNSLAGVRVDTSKAAFCYRSSQTDQKYNHTRGKEWAVRALPTAVARALLDRRSHPHPRACAVCRPS